MTRDEHERVMVAETARAGLWLVSEMRANAVEALSTLENYGRHHGWCHFIDVAEAKSPPPVPSDCNCGLIAALASLHERIDRKPGEARS